MGFGVSVTSWEAMRDPTSCLAKLYGRLATNFCDPPEDSNHFQKFYLQEVELVSLLCHKLPAACNLLLSARSSLKFIGGFQKNRPNLKML